MKNWGEDMNREVKIAGKIIQSWEDERSIHEEFENMVGGPNRAFRMVDIYRRAEQSASGNRFTIRKMPSVDEIFRDMARREGYSDKVIRFYLERVR